MPRVLLQPRGTRRVRGQENFEKSIERGLPLAACVPHLPPTQVAALRDLYGNEPVRLWGSTPTSETGNDKARALAERRVDDFVFFYAEKSFIAHARIGYLLDNVPLATAIWGVNDNGETWQHVMALVDVQHRRVPSVRLLAPLGRDEVVRSLTLLPQAASDQLIAAWEDDALLSDTRHSGSQT